MNKVVYPVKDLLVALGVLGVPLAGVVLAVMIVLGLFAPDDVFLSVSAIAAICGFVLAVVLAHVFHRST